MNCPFCNIDIEDSRVIKFYQQCVAVFDEYPVTDDHVLIIPQKHVSSYFDLGITSLIQINFLLEIMQKFLLEKDPSIEGFNVGINCGEVAGQTVDHCHVHLIPRRKGDVENPRGGVRNIFFGKGDYTVDGG